MYTVYEILHQKGPQFNTIDATEIVIHAIALMKAENFSYLIVFDKGEYVGIISERDYTHKVILNSKHSDTTLVKEIMTTDLPIVSPSTTGEECLLLMNASKSRYLPVFDNSEYKGVITIHDLMRETMRDKQSIENTPAEKFQQHYWI
jgi:CBS domain-containing protein